MSFDRLFGWTRRATCIAGAAALLMFSTGCMKNLDFLDPNKSFLDPGEMGRYSHEPLQREILDVIDPALEVARPDFAMATEPTAEDLQLTSTDYTISENDLLGIEITDLAGVGVTTVKTTRVSESGRVSLPYIGPVKAAGLTEIDLEEAIKKAYKDKGIIDNAQVSVTVVEARGRAFTILGAVNAPGQYAIVDPEFRVLQMLSLARDRLSPLVQDMYILRPAEAPKAGGPDGAAQPGTRPGPVDLTPQGRVPGVFPDMKRAAYLGADPVDLTPGAAPATLPALPPADPNVKGRYIYVEGKPVFIPDEPGAAPAPSVGTTPAIVAPALVAPAADPEGGAPRTIDANAARSGGGFAFADPSYSASMRVIHIPIDKLLSGSLQYNIVIRPKDTILVQNLPIGTYYMGGHVARPGAYSLTGTKVTLKQAIISASMLDALAIPERTDIVRRVGPNREVYVRVDLARIFAGQAPDIFLKAEDQVMVGTNALAPFLAAARGAFRLTYGFGFLYDRNFAVDEDQQSF